MNKSEFRAEMVRHGDSNLSLAKALNISAVSLSKKINSKVGFKQGEIAFIIDRYQLSPDDIDRIFFAPKVS